MSQPEIGITDEDRAKMGEWAQGGAPSAGGPRGHQSGSLPKSDNPVVKRVRLEVVIRAVIDGKEFVTAADLADELPYSSTQIGHALGRLQKEGLVEKFNWRQWRILEGSA